MKSLITSAATVSIVVLALCAIPAEGTVLRLSEFCSEDEHQPYLAEYLDARLDFLVVGSTLTFSVTNLTPENEDDPAFKINRLYFNVTENAGGLTLTDVYGPDDFATGGWESYFSQDGFLVGGFGRFDVYVKGGNGSHYPVVNAGQTISFAFQISGTGPFEDNDFVTLSSPQGGHIISYAAAKFYNDYTSAYGATSVPEPATVCMLALGGLMVLQKRRSGLN